jgi:hypothetical protein
MSPLQVVGGWFTLAAACSFIWGADAYPIKKLSDGRGLGLRWPPINEDTQQSTCSWRQRSDQRWKWGTWVVECMGGHSLYASNVKLSDTKNNKNKIHLALDGRWLIMVHTTTNQKHAGMAKYTLERRWDWGGAHKRSNSIILGLIEVERT